MKKISLINTLKKTFKKKKSVIKKKKSKTLIKSKFNKDVSKVKKK